MLPQVALLGCFANGLCKRRPSQLRQIAAKTASEQSSPNSEKSPRKLGEVMKRTSALSASELLIESPAIATAHARQRGYLRLTPMS
jgi:hypothetical protein